MGVENPTYISDLNTAWPLGSDAKSTADDHLRNFKTAVKNTFPSVTGAVTKTHTELNTVTDRGLITGQTWTGAHTFPATTYGVTATLGDSSLKYATTEFVANTAFSSALPAQLGNSGKLLTTNGTDASWTETKTINGNSLIGSGNLVLPNGLTLLATVTPTAAANLDFLSMFSSTYDNYLIIGNNITVAADDSILIRFANAGTVDTGSKYYSTSSASALSFTSASTSIQGSANITTAGKGCSFVLEIKNANDSTNLKAFHSRFIGQSGATPSYQSFYTDGVYQSANAISGFRLYLNGGSNFGATGRIRVFGYQNS